MSTPIAKSNAWTWSFPGAPISIKVDFGFIQMLQAQLGPDAEIGGVLLGCPGKTADVIEIRDVAWVPSISPDQYELDMAQVETLRQQPPRLAEGGARLSVVGFFRTQREGILELRESEVDLVLKSFARPTDVVLLVRTTPQNTGGFFVWYGDVFTPYSFRDFPFDVASLQSEASAPKPAPSMKSRPIVKIEKLEEVIEPVAESKPEPETYPIPEVWNPSPLTSALPAPESRPRRRRVAVIAVSLVALAGVAGFLLRDRVFLPAKPPAPVAAPVTIATAVPDLKLQVADQGNGFNVRWDPEATQAAQVKEGRLVIVEHEQQPLIVNLDPEQLATGHVYYKPTTDRVAFRLEVTEKSGRVLKESVLAVSTNPIPTASAPPPVEPAKPLPAKNAKSVRVSILPRLYTPGPVPVRSETPRPVLDAAGIPTTASAIAAPGLNAGSALNGRVQAPPPPPPPAPVVTPASAPGAAASLELPIPAVPTRRVTPTLVRSVAALMPANKEITVSVNVHLDENGRVIKADALQHDPGAPARLIKDSIDAAMQWQFQPARRGNTPIPSEYTVRFGFQR